MRVGTVVEVWRYPVKSLGGERLTGRAQVTAEGIEGDRRFAVADAATGKLLSAKTVPELLRATATWDGAGVRITSADDGLDVTSADGDVDDRLSSWVGRPVRLERPVPGRRAAFDNEVDPDDPTETYEIQTPPGRFFDSRSVLHLLTTASLGPHDVRRFRPNLLVDSAEDEDGWVDRRLRVGDVLEATVRKRTGRCVLVTKPQPGLPKDSSVLRDLVRTRNGDLGIYVDPQTIGPVAPGDAVAVVAA